METIYNEYNRKVTELTNKYNADSEANRKAQLEAFKNRDDEKYEALSKESTLLSQKYAEDCNKLSEELRANLEKLG